MHVFRRAWSYTPFRLGAIISGLTAATIFFLPGLRVGDYSADRFLPHATCYLRDPGLIWLNVISDSFIALAYLSISAVLVYIVLRARRDIPFHWMFIAFGLFIVTCGITHIMSVVTVWRPYYWLAGDIKAITAVASVATAVVLPFTVPRVFSMIHSARLSDQRKLDLESANERLRESDELKSQFFANVSHELRTPLALILGPIQRHLEAGTLPPAASEDLAVAERNARMLLQQVNNLLEVARIEAGGTALEYARTDVAQLVRLVASNFEVLAREKGIALEIEAPATLEAEVDASLVERIILNVLSNAFKFTPDNGRITVTLAEDDGDLELIVDDSGPGVPEHLRDAVFERFRQVNGGSSRGAGGTGLGLTIVREFVDLHDGEVGIFASPYGGARVLLRVPLRAPDEADVAARPAPSDAGLNRTALDEIRLYRQPEAPVESVPDDDRALVLVVEDNPEMRQMISKILGDRFRVATATNGHDGLERARALLPDLIVADMMMPGMSGDEMIDQMQKEADLRETPVVVLTARADDEQRVDLLESGVVDHLTKPFSADELLARVSGPISRRRATIRKLREVNTTLEHRVLERTHQVRQQADQLRRLATELSTTEQRERRRLAEALHDNLQQLLVGARLTLEQAQMVGGEGAGELLDRVGTVLGDAIAASRNVARELFPPVLYDRGLIPALHWLARHVEEQHGLAVGVTSEAGAEPVSQDLRSFLFSSVRELLLNVVKHAQSSDARVAVTIIDGRIIIDVEDDGVGCDPALMLESQADNFGLFNIRERLNILGGTMTVRSAPGEGCRVRLECPLDAAAGSGNTGGETDSEFAREEESGSAPGGPDGLLRVLLVDDHRILREGLTGILNREQGMVVIGEAGDGRTALTLVEQLSPDVVVMDVSLPIMDGIEATQHIRGRWPEVRIVALSMHAERDMAAAMLAAGADVYVTKGGPASELLAAIRG